MLPYTCLQAVPTSNKASVRCQLIWCVVSQMSCGTSGTCRLSRSVSAGLVTQPRIDPRAGWDVVAAAALDRAEVLDGAGTAAPPLSVSPTTTPRPSTTASLRTPATIRPVLPQQQKLAILLDEHDVTDRAVGDQFGRTFTTSKELTPKPRRHSSSTSWRTYPPNPPNNCLPRPEAETSERAYQPTVHRTAADDELARVGVCLEMWWAAVGTS